MGGYKRAANRMAGNSRNVGLLGRLQTWAFATQGCGKWRHDASSCVKSMEHRQPPQSGQAISTRKDHQCRHPCTRLLCYRVVVLSQISASAHSRQNDEHSHLGVNIAGLTSGLLLDMASRAMRDGSEYDSRSGRSAMGEWRQQKKQSLHGTLAGHRPG